MEIVEINGLNEPVRPVQIESLPQATQDMILGITPDDEAAYWAAYGADCKRIEAGSGPDDAPDYGDL